jgi:hypothetical protein
MQRIIKVTLGALLLGLSLPAQTLVLPHVVDGQGWQSTIVLTNTAATAASATLVFHQETTGGNTTASNPPFIEVVSTAGLSLTGGSTMFLHTMGTAADLWKGWAELNADPGIIGYVVFTNRASGHQNDGTAPAAPASSRILVPYDDSSGSFTGIAIANPTATAQNVAVGFRTTTGGVAMGAPFSVPAFGHMSFILSQQFPVINGHEGLAEFYSATGNLSMIALRFNPTLAFTSAPVYFQSGAPLIAAGSSSGSDPNNPPPYDPNNPYGYIYMYQSTGGVR